MPFSITTYNILADSYIKPERYPRTPATILDPTRRRPALVERIAGLGSDVICLQEVEPDVFAALDARLRPLGYEGRLARKRGGKPDGCASFYQRDAFAIRGVHILNYRDGWGGQPDSGCLALTLMLTWQDYAVAVVNTHLKWDSPSAPREEKRGYRQASQLVAERDMIDPAGEAWIVCGDLNATADSEVLRLFREDGFDYSHRGREQYGTCNSNDTAKMIDFLLFSSALTARPADLPAIDAQTPLPSDAEPSDHLAVTATFEWARPGAH